MRNDGLASLAGTLRRRGFDENFIAKTLLNVNESCDPPLPPEEVAAIARSIAKYSASTERNLTDEGNAERLIDEHGRDLLYSFQRQRRIFWTGRRWETDERGEVQRRAKATIRALYRRATVVEDEDARKRLARHACQSESRSRLENMVVLAQKHRPVSPDEFDRDPWLLNVRNGVVDLRTGALMPHRRECFSVRSRQRTFMGR